LEHLKPLPDNFELQKPKLGIKVDARSIVATNRNLEDEVCNGRFRTIEIIIFCHPSRQFDVSLQAFFRYEMAIKTGRFVLIAAAPWTT
jgi:hypothetical protein